MFGTAPAIGFFNRRFIDFCHAFIWTRPMAPQRLVKLLLPGAYLNSCDCLLHAAALRALHGTRSSTHFSQCASHHCQYEPRLFLICHFRVQELNAQDLNNLMHAYAKLGVLPKRLAPACAHELKRRLPCPSFMLQDLITLLWSFCILEVRPPASGSLPHSHWLASEKPPGHNSELLNRSHVFILISCMCGLCVLCVWKCLV